GYLQDGDWVMYSNIDLTCAASFDVRASSPTNGGNVEVRLGSSTGTLIGTVSVSSTGSWNNWSTFSASINSTSGQQDVYLVFTGGSGYLFNLDWLEFSTSSSSRIASGFETAETLEGESGISVYPNPVADRLTVLTPSSDFDQFEIYALNGQVVQQGSIARDIEELSIDFTALEKGVYILKLKGIHSDKQVKIHKQ
ncbi:MAG: carbohydrate-binding protein, partial [Marinoscillum sp.]